VFEQGGSSGKVAVVDLSSFSDEQGLIPDTSRNEEFAKRLFNDLNRDILGSPDDGKVIILSNSDEKEEEIHKEDATGAEVAPSSVVGIPASIASTADTDEAPTRGAR
jgi:hypothetical protein